MITVGGKIVAAMRTSVARDQDTHIGQYDKGQTLPRLAHLKPRAVWPSPWFPRNQTTPAALEQRAVLLASIRCFGGNLQPIKVRPVVQRQHAEDSEPHFELVYGGCRLQACVDLNLPVFALIEELTDRQAFAQANSEKFHAPALTFLERGTVYARAIDQGTFRSARELAAATGTPAWVVDRSLAVHALMEVMDEMLPNFQNVHEHWSRKIADFAERFPDETIALSHSTDALHWLNVIQAARGIDPTPRQMQWKVGAREGATSSGELPA